MLGITVDIYHLDEKACDKAQRSHARWAKDPLADGSAHTFPSLSAQYSTSAERKNRTRLFSLSENNGPVQSEFFSVVTGRFLFSARAKIFLLEKKFLWLYKRGVFMYNKCEYNL